MTGPIDPRLLRRSRATRRQLVATVVIGLAQTVAIVAQAWLIATSVVTIVGGSGLSDDLLRRLSLLAAVVAVRSALAWLQQWSGHRASAAVKSQLRTDVMAARLARPYDAEVSQGRLTVLVGQGLDALDGWYARFLPQLVLGILAPLVVVVLIGVVDPLSAVIVVITLPLIPLFMVLVGWATQRQLDRRWRANAVLGHRFADLVAGLTTLQLFGRARSQGRGLVHTESRHRTETMRTLRVAFLSALVLELLATLSVALVAVTVGLRVVDAQMALLPALFVLVLAPEAFLPLRQVGVHYHDAADGMAAAEEAFTIIERAESSAGEPSQIPAVQRVQLDQVTSDRTGSVSAQFCRGEVTVIVGASGSGKTTALRMLMGWLSPTSGAVLLDGVPLGADNAAAWRRQVAWVSQDPALVPGTVAENIIFGTGATADQAREALDRCGGGEIPTDLVIGDDNHGLSIGQRRRVALARALVRIDQGAGWLVLDEPTAGLDAETEAAVVAGLPQGIGVILVSHRPAVLAAADRVVEILAVPAPATTVARTPVASPAPASPAEEPGRSRARLWLAVLLGVLAAGSGVALIGTAGWLLSRAAEHPPVLHLMVAVTLVRAFGVGKGVFRYAERLVGHEVALRDQSGRRLSTYRQLMDRVIAGDLAARRQDLVSRLTQDVAASLDLTVRVFLPRAVAVVVGLAAVTAFWSVTPAAGVVLALGLIVAGLVGPWLGDRLTRHGQQRLSTAQAELAESTGRIHRLAPELNAHQRSAEQLAELAARDRELRQIEQHAASATGVGAAVQVGALGLAGLVALVLAAPAVSEGQIAATLVAVLALVPLALLDVVQPLTTAALARRAGGAALARVERLGATLPTVAAARVSDQTPRTLAAVELDDVAVGWQQPVAHGIDLTVTAGDRVAITGPSGSGKTTLALTVAGLLAPLAGTVRVQGRVGMLSQDAHLFDTTVRENLRLAAPNADDATLHTALSRAGLDLDLDRRIGEHGATVSGGEARRIALARLLLREIDVVILDEPTEHLDATTAEALLVDIDRLWPDAAMLVITHDAATTAELLHCRQWCLPGSREALAIRAGGPV